MGYDAKVLADSVSEAGRRLTTIEARFPRFILAEVNTHRMLARSSASSRAIPVEKRIIEVEADPFVPESFGKNQRGMQALVDLEANEAQLARQEWLLACRMACSHAKTLAGLGVHKQLANRLIEPFAWHTAIITATDWDNFFNLRRGPEAQPEFKRIADLMWEAREASLPMPVAVGEWHLPLIDDEDRSWALCADPPGSFADKLVRVSVARCARVSYLTHDGRRDRAEDLALYDRLVAPGHMSPLEHVARPMTARERELFVTRNLRGDAFGYYCGCFDGWVQHRKHVAGERVFERGTAK